MRGSTLLTESELDRTLRIDEQKGEPGQTSPVWKRWAAFNWEGRVQSRQVVRLRAARKYFSALAINARIPVRCR